MSDNFVVISGCSGGGKSTLITELAARGFATVPEPGRRIVAQELAGDGTALPWVDLAAFAHRAIDLALADREQSAGVDDWVFFDRGLVDAVSALEASGAKPGIDLGARKNRYHPTVFMTPPWPEIYATDTERKHGIEEALAEYERLAALYPTLGYDVVTLPKVSVPERAAFVLTTLAIRGWSAPSRGRQNSCRSGHDRG